LLSQTVLQSIDTVSLCSVVHPYILHLYSNVPSRECREQILNVFATKK
jgi:hypothetical protein